MSSRVPALSPLTLRGFGPERLVRGGEHAGVACGGQRGGALQRARLVAEDFKVVIQLDRLTTTGDDPLMPRHCDPAVEHDQFGGAEGDADLPTR